jgi:hypothetical protein
MLTAQNNSFPLVSAHLIVAELAVSTFPWNLKGNGFETNWCAGIGLQAVKESIKAISVVITVSSARENVYLITFIAVSISGTSPQKCILHNFVFCCPVNVLSNHFTGYVHKEICP